MEPEELRLLEADMVARIAQRDVREREARERCQRHRNRTDGTQVFRDLLKDVFLRCTCIDMPDYVLGPDRVPRLPSPAPRWMRGKRWV